jgi:putative alpha-1,2-mannosidase
MALVARATGVLPLVCGVLAAAALAGAAVFTVEQTSCSTESHYVRSGDSLVLVGNCLTGSTIPNGSVQAAGDGVQGDRTQSRP